MAHKRPWELVTDPSYFRKVMGNMVALGFGPKHAVATVRFGLTGIGHAPNYQIEGPDGVKHCFRGMGHVPCSEVGEEFAVSNLSAEAFTYEDLKRFLSNLVS